MRLSTAALVISACALCACTARQQDRAQQQVQSGTLTAAVAARLATVDVDSTTAVKVSANGSTVTLDGEAHSAKERADYEAAAKGVPGVDTVIDNLRINPQLRGARAQLSDAAISAKVAAAIAGQAGINVFHVSQSVRDAVVTVTGTVPSQSVKTTILQTVRATGGVRGVVDRITVKPQ